MNVLLLTTATPDTQKFEASITGIGHTCATIRYDNARHSEIVATAGFLQPDFIVYLGLFPTGPTPEHTRGAISVENLFKLQKIGKLIHIVCDASEPGWWPALEHYDAADVFDAVVSIDGSIGTPFDKCKRTLATLSPIPLHLYKPMPWESRPVPFGFAGSVGSGSARAIVIRDLLKTGRFTVQDGEPATRPYRRYCEWLSCVRCSLNHGITEAGKAQVKGRVLETAFAEAILIESRGSATQHWFDAGAFLQYSDAEEALDQLFWVNTHDLEARAMRDRLTQQVHEKHHPKMIWNSIFEFASK